MSFALNVYRSGAGLLEPLVPHLLAGRVKAGKERLDRQHERLAIELAPRPVGKLAWLHGASVGEIQLLLEVFALLKLRVPDLHAVATSQTLTSADLVARIAPPDLVHQMAPVDTPTIARRFAQHWTPDVFIFAEGEIWPNLLLAAQQSGSYGILANARMTSRSLDSWSGRKASARKVFSAFRFIGAADQATASGLSAILDRQIDVVGNLKQAAPIKRPDEAVVTAFQTATDFRPILVAASTHPGEEEIVVHAFSELRRNRPDLLLIIAPRHPNRGRTIFDLVERAELRAQLRSSDASPPSSAINVLVADTMGEMGLWYALASAVYLGGAHAPGVGGHNPFEPVQFRRAVVTGPLGFNFKDTFAALEHAGALSVANRSEDVTVALKKQLDGRIDIDAPAIEAFFAKAQAPMELTIAAAVAALVQPRSKTSSNA